MRTEEHNPIRHLGELRCCVCGHVACGGIAPPVVRCDCGSDVLRTLHCLDCGFRLLTGGPSLSDLILGPRQ